MGASAAVEPSDWPSDPRPSQSCPGRADDKVAIAIFGRWAGWQRAAYSRQTLPATLAACAAIVLLYACRQRWPVEHPQSVFTPKHAVLAAHIPGHTGTDVSHGWLAG